MNHFRPAASVIALALTVAGCGGGSDDTAPATTTIATADVAAPPTAPGPSDTEAPAPAPAPAAGELPVPTIASDAPEEFLDGIGPIATVGDALPQLPDDGDDPAVGQVAPILVGENFDGDRVVIDPANDGPTWLIFLAHWCPHCNDEIPVINELRDAGRIPEGVRIVGVSTAVNPGRPNFPPGTWLDDKDWTYEVLADGIDVEEQSFVAAVAYGVTGFPFSVLVDGDGLVTERWSGGREADELVSLLTNNLTLG